MDIIFLHDLRIETVIGIWEWERKIRQTVAIDLEMSADIRKAAATYSVEDTLNYKLVAKRLQSFVGESEFQLVETLAFLVESEALSHQGGGVQVDLAGADVERGLHVRRVCDAHRRAVHGHLQIDDRGQAVGDGVQQHRLAADHGKAGCQLDGN